MDPQSNKTRSTRETNLGAQDGDSAARTHGHDGGNLAQSTPEFNIIPATPIKKSFADVPRDARRSYVPPNFMMVGNQVPEEVAVDFEESNAIRPIKVQWSPNLSLQTRPERKEKRKSR